MAAGVVAAAVAVVGAPRSARSALAQTWPPFVLVAGLLLVGVVAHGDGLFDAAGTRLGRVGRAGRSGRVVLLLTLLALVAAVTVVLNLDTSVAFLTPVLVLSARHRRLDERPFLYGTLVMSNAASLLLPGSNLTNLLVVGQGRESGLAFARHMAGPWLAAVLVTALVVLLLPHRERVVGDGDHHVAVPFRGGVGVAATVVAAALVVALRSPALPVLLVGGAAVAWRRVGFRRLVAALDPLVLGGVFLVAVALGTLARVWDGPAHLLAHAGRLQTAVLGAVAAVVVNNLPAAVLLGSRHPLHPHALLVGLDLGPNLAVTGSLSAVLWYQAARSVRATPSVRTVSAIGLVAVPLSMAAALVLLAPH